MAWKKALKRAISQPATSPRQAGGAGAKYRPNNPPRPSAENTMSASRAAWTMPAFKRVQAGGDGHGIARERSCLIHRAKRRKMRHNIAPSAKGGERETAADNFPQAGQIGPNTVQRLRAAERDPKTADDFIKNQHGAVFSALRAQCAQKFCCATHQIHIACNGFDNHGGDLVAKLRKSLADLLKIVVFEYSGCVRNLVRHAGWARLPAREQSGACLDEQTVCMAVIAPFKLDDARAASERAREPQRAHGRFGAAADQPHLFDGRGECADFLGVFNLAFGGRAKAEPKCQPRLYGGERRPVQMACDHSAPGADIIDITCAFGIPEVRPKRALDKTGDAAYGGEGAHRRVHAARNALFGSLKQDWVTGHAKSTKSSGVPHSRAGKARLLAVRVVLSASARLASAAVRNS